MKFICSAIIVSDRRNVKTISARANSWCRHRSVARPWLICSGVELYRLRCRMACLKCATGQPPKTATKIANQKRRTPVRRNLRVWSCRAPPPCRLQRIIIFGGGTLLRITGANLYLRKRKIFGPPVIVIVGGDIKLRVVSFQCRKSDPCSAKWPTDFTSLLGGVCRLCLNICSW